MAIATSLKSVMARKDGLESVQSPRLGWKNPGSQVTKRGFGLIASALGRWDADIHVASFVLFFDFALGFKEVQRSV